MVATKGAVAAVGMTGSNIPTVFVEWGGARAGGRERRVNVSTTTVTGDSLHWLNDVDVGRGSEQGGAGVGVPLAWEKPAGEEGPNRERDREKGGRKKGKNEIMIRGHHMLTQQDGTGQCCTFVKTTFNTISLLLVIQNM
uniref:Uncharacterized protein n=1 Tax=Oryza barthii TaxID=65489 RepID=A0A0D3G0T7_9ORYZ